jgi:hypothetical protein
MRELTETSKVTVSTARSSERAHPPALPHDAVMAPTALAKTIGAHVHIMAASLNGWTKPESRIHLLEAL